MSCRNWRVVPYCSASTLCVRFTTVTNYLTQRGVVYLFDLVKVHGEEDIFPVVFHDVRRNWFLKYLRLDQRHNTQCTHM